MAKTYQDAIPPEGGREYRLTQLPNGNYTIEDVTVYTQEGTPWGATDVNSILQNMESMSQNINSMSRDIAGKMPKSGGIFTGNVEAYSSNRRGDSIRNIVVADSSWNPASTNKLVALRK